MTDELLPTSRRGYISALGVAAVLGVGTRQITQVAAGSGGQDIWTFSTGDHITSAPTVVDGTVYVGSQDQNLYAVDAATGQEQWTFSTDDAVEVSPSVVDGTVYLTSLELSAVDAATGQEQWTFSTGSNIYSSPTVVDGTVFVGSWNGLYAVDAATGQERWVFSTDRNVRSSPTVVDGTVFVGSNDDNLYAVDAATGRERWAFATGGSVTSSPTVVDGTVYVGSWDGNLYAVAAGVDGSSEGSRVMLGTLGHHGAWAERAGSADGGPPSGFSPTRHGFGFTNWGTTSGRYPGHEHDRVSIDEVRQTIENTWSERLATATHLSFPAGSLATDALALKIYTNVNQGAGTNGHCYGMAYAAEAYYKTPDVIPVDADSASAIPEPTGPYRPVGDDIDYYHNTQYLEYDAWAARQAVFGSEDIDYDAQLEAITSALDETGTAGLTMHSTGRGWGHQILATGYSSVGDRVEVAVYDPNIAAGSGRYSSESTSPSVTFDTSGDRTTVEPYDGVYDRIVYSNVDGRLDPTAMLRLGTDQASQWFESLLTNVVTFLTQSPVELTVTDADGSELSRISSEAMSLEPTEYDHVRTDIGTTSREYEVELTGTAEGEYTLEVQGQRDDGSTLSSTVEGQITEGETRRYRAVLPDDSSEDPRLEPAEHPTQSSSVRGNPGVLGGLPSWVPIAGAAAVGAGLYKYLGTDKSYRRHQDK